METKTDFRRRMKALRDAIPTVQREQGAEVIRDRVLALPEVIAAGSVFCYVSIGSEVDTHGLIRALLAAGKGVRVPRIAGPGEMVAVPVGRFEDLTPGRWGILEPRAAEAAVRAADVSLVPGVAFTRRGERLGMGGGFYDRYLAAHPATTAVGLAFEQQVVHWLPTEPHDARVSRVITERA